ncbi:hypothetical protein [Salipaludibacillus sp. CF4.18]|uniref:hypothetical protein n=1 Tax=Salipaludibacillus sp. CF4.18 TaxID=3373081 RepID=UPI003EE785F6
MEETKWGIVGIGKLGTAILTQFELLQMRTGVFHPDTDKTELIEKQYSYTSKLQKDDLASLDHLILALPTSAISSFIDKFLATGLKVHKPVLINMATSLPTEELKQQYPHLTWLGMKFLGHSESLKRYGDGLFIMEENDMENHEFYEVMKRFSKLGQVEAADESIVEKVNKLATYQAIKAAREVELKMDEEGLSDRYKEQALRSIVPEVIRAYSNGKLGHFAQEIVQKLDRESK